MTKVLWLACVLGAVAVGCAAGKAAVVVVVVWWCWLGLFVELCGAGVGLGRVSGAVGSVGQSEARLAVVGVSCLAVLVGFVGLLADRLPVVAFMCFWACVGVWGTLACSEMGLLGRVGSVALVVALGQVGAAVGR